MGTPDSFGLLSSLSTADKALLLPAADAAGWVDVDKATTRHNEFPNVFSIGDASSLPNSKTAAAITRQVPVLVSNLVAAAQGRDLTAAYDGYASCPLLTGHGELMLCEFKYGGVPKETFAGIMGGQETPRRAFYHLKKDVFVSVAVLARFTVHTLTFGVFPLASRGSTGLLFSRVSGSDLLAS